MITRLKMSRYLVAAVAVTGLSACSTTGGTAANNPTDAQMQACRTAAESYWQAPSGTSHENTTTKTAEGGFDVQITTNDQYRTTCSISASGDISTRPGW